MKRIECDVLVVGAGAAGSVAALKAAKEGLKTVLIEKTSKIGGHCQTKIDVTESTGVEEIFEELKLPILAKSNVSRWFSPNQEIEFGSDVSDFFIKRGPDEDSFETMTARRAKKEGCELYLNTEIGPDLKIIINNKRKVEIDYKYLVDAEGCNSNLLKKNGIKPSEDVRISGYGRIMRNLEMPANVTYVLLDNEIMPGGYFYLAKTRGLESACIVFSKPIKQNEMKARFDKLVNKHSELHKIFGKASQISEFCGASTASTIRKRTNGNIFFIGDAGRLLDPLFGYGVRQAVYSGYYAAKAISEAKTVGEATEKYENKIVSLIAEFTYARKGRKIFENMSNTELDDAIGFANYSKNTVGLDATIDSPTKAIATVAKYSIKNPRFAPLAFKAVTQLLF